MAEKENRCWPGYEPVKGKPEHSQGSCKPKAEGKSTPSEKKSRAKRSGQLDEWEKQHPGSKRSAAQHLKSPTAKASKKAPAKKKPARKRAS